MADDGAPPPETAENEAPAEGEVADGGAGEAPPAEEALAEAPTEEAPAEGGEGGGEGAAPASAGGEGGAAPEAATPAAAVAPAKQKEDYDPIKLRFDRGLPGRGFLPYYSVELKHSYGWETEKRNNLHRLGDSKLLTSSGTSVLMIDLQTLEQQFLPGIDCGGVGAICVHPSGNFFAVGERQLGGAPNVYIYEFPSLKLVNVLRNGTERAFTDMRFSNDGEMLATVGSFPDYLLHIWDWKSEAVTLRAKAFSQEVFNVIFSPRFDGTLYTSGTGHIRFWKMADTFTGLKLQGEIGKFGAIELSDVSCFVELKDGKVVTGSEGGNLLLWDGGLVKVEIKPKGGGTCHKGMIEMVWQHEDFIVSAGVDGYMRFWEYALVDLAEPEDDVPHCHIAPANEVKIVDESIGDLPVKVKTMHLDPTGKYKEWLIQDDAGGLWRCDYTNKMACKRIKEFHAGSIVGSDTSPVGPFYASAGSDGTVRLHDMDDQKTLYAQSFPQPCTFLQWAPPVVDQNATSVVVGFKDGVVRILQQLRDCWHLQHVIKPHTQGVTSAHFSRDGKFLATCSTDGLLWFQVLHLNTREYRAICLNTL
jgi:WD40 repeat protein